MTRADFKTVAWLGLLAGVLAFGLLFWSDPCLDREIGNFLRSKNPPAAAAASEATLAPDAAAVANPYGITPCHHWPDAWEHAISLGAWGAITLLIGFLSARKFQQHARFRAAAILFVMLILTLAFDVLVYLPSNLVFFERWGYALLLKPIALMLALALGVATIAWSCAAFTLRFRPRD